MNDPTRPTLGTIPPTANDQNRAEQIAIDTPTAKPIQISLQQINDILLTYLKDTIKPTITENTIATPVNVLYGTPERWAAIRQNGYLRDYNNQKLLTPLIVLRRTNVTRNQLTNPNNKYLYRTVDTGWNARNVYDKFAVQNGITPSRRMNNIMIPDYMDLTYEVILWTEYQQQMDELIEQINVEADEFWGAKNNYKFRVSINEFVAQSDLPVDADRIIRTTFQMKVAAYILPERIIRNFNLATPTVEYFTAKKTVMIVETVNTFVGIDHPVDYASGMFGSIPPQPSANAEPYFPLNFYAGRYFGDYFASSSNR